MKWLTAAPRCWRPAPRAHGALDQLTVFGTLLTAAVALGAGLGWLGRAATRRQQP